MIANYLNSRSHTATGIMKAMHDKYPDTEFNTNVAFHFKPDDVTIYGDEVNIKPVTAMTKTPENKFVRLEPLHKVPYVLALPAKQYRSRLPKIQAEYCTLIIDNEQKSFIANNDDKRKSLFYYPMRIENASEADVNHLIGSKAKRDSASNEQFIKRICFKESLVDKYPSGDSYELGLVEWYTNKLMDGVEYDQLVKDAEEEWNMNYRSPDDRTYAAKMKVLKWIKDQQK